jgi:uncharacterized membrane protein (UPF0127 family)
MVTAVRAFNLTRNTVLIEHGEVANAFLTRLRGLIGHQPLASGQGLLISPCSSVHMFLMNFPIDVLFVDGTDQVVGLAPDLRPNRIGPVVRRARYVLELPVGTIARTGTQVGDQLAVEAHPT